MIMTKTTRLLRRTIMLTKSTVKLVDEGDMVLRCESKKKMEISLMRKTKSDRKKSESEMKNNEVTEVMREREG